MTNNITICTPSRGRAETSKWLKYAQENGLCVFVFVEPHEYKNYAEAFPGLHIYSILQSGKGIAYARNFIRETMDKWMVETYWSVDDDVDGFYYREDAKMVRDEPLAILRKAEQQLLEAGVAYGSLEYRQIAWSATKPIKLGSYADGPACWFDNRKLGKLMFDNALPLKVDRDFAIQVLTAGLRVGRSTLYAFSCPACGTNKGGLKEIVYDHDSKIEAAIQMMIIKWGERICSRVDKDKGGKTSVDVKIRWDAIASPQSSLF